MSLLHQKQVTYCGFPILGHVQNLGRKLVIWVGVVEFLSVLVWEECSYWRIFRLMEYQRYIEAKMES